MVDRDREPSASGAHEGIAHETLYPPDETFHFSFVLLQEVEKRLRAFAGITSNDSMHDTPPTADVLHVNHASPETTRFHHAARQRGGDVAARGARAAGGPNAPYRRAHRLLQGRPRGATSRHGLAAEAARVGMGRWP